MVSFYDVNEPTKMDLLVGFYDLTGYIHITRDAEPDAIFELMAGYFDLTGEILEKAGGWLVKPIGDAGLAAFPAEEADAGVAAFLELKRQGDEWLRSQGINSHAVVKLHLGPVVCGPIGAPGRKRPDIYGHTVNVAATLEAKSFAISSQAFRRLDPESRKAFKKHTPPVTYIRTQDKH